LAPCARRAWSSMQLKDAVLGDVPMIVASGSVDQGTCGALQAALNQRLEARHNIVFLDISDVTQMDNAGLSVLVTWVQALGGKGWLGIIGPDVNVRPLLEGEGLLAHPNVRVFETRHAALIVTGERQST
jgi:anti-anti-sigma factor